jgi:opacity protein-like surface antigen
MKTMKWNSFSRPYLLSFLLLSPLSCLAESNNRVEIQVQGGISDVSFTGPNEIVATPIETDTLRQTNDESVFQGSVGVGYVLPLNVDEKTSCWFSDLKLGLNFYGFNSKNKGDALEFGQDDLNNFTYSLDVDSRRLMLDLYLTVFSWKDWSVFALAGTGESWNNIKYSQTPNADIPGVNVKLNEHSDTAWAFETGAGITYDFTEHFSLSLEYLYTHFNTLQTSDHGQIADHDATFKPLEFDLHTNTLFLGLTLAM